MTHDETYQTDKFDELRLKILNSFEKPVKIALLAVVELHKPSSVNAKECETCTLHTDYSDRYIAYPCETIQAIEKELS
jgi:hypothetical protein